MIKGLGRYTKEETTTLQRPYHRLLPSRMLLVLQRHPLMLIFLLLYEKVNVLSNLLPNILLQILSLMSTSTPPFELFLLLFPKNLFSWIMTKPTGFPIGS